MLSDDRREPQPPREPDLVTKTAERDEGVEMPARVDEDELCRYISACPRQTANEKVILGFCGRNLGSRIKFGYLFCSSYPHSDNA